MSLWLYHGCYIILFYFNFFQFSSWPASKESQEVTRELHVKGGASEKGDWASTAFVAGSLVGRFARHNRDLDNHSHDDDDDGDGNENVKKAIGLITRQQLCTCITLFCTFLCLHCTTTTWKCLISRFREEVTRATTKFPLSFWTWIWFLGIQL